MMDINCAIIQFPGTLCDIDFSRILKNYSHSNLKIHLIWHKEKKLPPVDLIILPGGFSFGDYWRTGMMACFSPIMPAIIEMAQTDVMILGVCNGFQILCESGLLPGILLKNRGLHFKCAPQYLIGAENIGIPNLQGELLQLPIAHGEGRYYADQETLKILHQNKQILFYYCDQFRNQSSSQSNPNGSVNNIAGVCNDRGNVLGMMPHPERTFEFFANKLRIKEDGKKFFRALFTKKTFIN